MAKLIAVCGATGNQGQISLPCHFFHRSRVFDSDASAGGSTARGLLRFPANYSVRALTRNPQSEAAKKLADLGAEVVKADLTVPSEVTAALSGCWGVFAVTDYYDTV